MKISIVAGLLLCLLAVVFMSGEAAAEIKLGEGNGSNANRHNFSYNRQGSGTLLKANDPTDPNSTRLCVFCHTPHGATAQSTLWNRVDPVRTSFVTFGQPAGIEIDGIAEAQYGTDYPNGATKLCLSCHDGVTAVGDMFNGTQIQMNHTTMDEWVVAGGNSAAVFDSASASGTTNGTLELSRTHPVSFVYTQNVVDAIETVKGLNTYNLPPANSGMLDSQNRFQCTTCHDPHTDTRVTGTYDMPFWRGYTGNEQVDYDAVCDSCHQVATGPGGPGGVHNL